MQIRFETYEDAKDVRDSLIHIINTLLMALEESGAGSSLCADAIESLACLTRLLAAANAAASEEEE